MIGAANNGTLLRRQGYVVAIVDLILANLCIVISCVICSGLSTASISERHYYWHNELEEGTPTWGQWIVEILQVPILFIFSNDIFREHLFFFSLITFSIESGLFILLIQGTRKLESYTIRLWFRIRFVMFLLTFLSIVIRTVTLRYEIAWIIVLEQGSLGILYLTYRGYQLVLATFLEELAYKRLYGSTLPFV